MGTMKKKTLRFGFQCLYSLKPINWKYLHISNIFLIKLLSYTTQVIFIGCVACLTLKYHLLTNKLSKA